MLKHYSHIRMQAKRRAVAALAKKATATAEPKTESIPVSPAKEFTKVRFLN